MEKKWYESLHAADVTAEPLPPSNRWATMLPTSYFDSYSQMIGLIGSSVEHRMLLALYSAAFDALELEWRCVPLSVPAGRLDRVLHDLWPANLAGFELAAPHQRDALPYLDTLTPAAEAIQAVNLVRLGDNGRLAGDNTQWLGFSKMMSSVLSSPETLRASRPLVIGIGEDMQAIIYALLHQGLPVTVISPHIAQAIESVDKLRDVSEDYSMNLYRWPHDLARAALETNLIVNTVPDETWPDEVPFPPNATVFDLTSLSLSQTGSEPYASAFLRQARTAGAHIVDVVQLLTHRAAVTFERWTGQAPPLSVLLEAAHSALPEAETDRVPIRANGHAFPGFPAQWALTHSDN